MNAERTLYVRRAQLGDDIDQIYRWRAETVAWLARRHPGVDQWQAPYPRANLERWVERGETFMAAFHPGGPSIATVTSSSEGDPELWTPDELEVPARYVSKLNVTRALTGGRYGVGLMDWARTKAAVAGAEVVRIDVWTTNTALHDFYRQLGFEYVRTVPGVNSGALFEIRAEEVPHPVVELPDPFDGEAAVWAASA